jgi:DNA-directed RNA polymerase specialized sigma24 family protein
MTAPAVAVEDVQDAFAFVGAIVTRRVAPSADAQEREELVAEGVAELCAMRRTWSGGGAFSAYASAHLPARLVEKRRLSRAKTEALCSLDAIDHERSGPAGEDPLYGEFSDIVARIYWARRMDGVGEAQAYRQARVAGYAALGLGPGAIAEAAGVKMRTVERDLAAVRAVGTVPLMVASAIPTSVSMAHRGAFNGSV